MAVLQAYKGVYYFWNYLPSPTASVVFAILFLAIGILHFWRVFKLRTWFCLPFAIGCLCEIIGYVFRTAAYPNTASLIFYVMQSVFLVIPPAFFAASIYMTLSRIIRCVKGEHLSIIRMKWLTRTFVVGDYLSLQIQGAAAGMTKPDVAQLGQDIVLVGLFIQLALLGLFFTTAITFHVRLEKRPTTESLASNKPWKQTLYMVYVASALIFLRSVFRVVEYIQGRTGYSLKHEWTLYVFDAVLMLTVTVIFYYWYPGYVAPAIDSDATDVEMDSGKFMKWIVRRGL